MYCALHPINLGLPEVTHMCYSLRPNCTWSPSLHSSCLLRNIVSVRILCIWCIITIYLFTGLFKSAHGHDFILLMLKRNKKTSLDAPYGSSYHIIPVIALVPLANVILQLFLKYLNPTQDFVLLLQWKCFLRVPSYFWIPTSREIYLISSTYDLLVAFGSF